MLFKCDVPKEIFKYIKENIRNFEKPANKNLAGNIRNEFKFNNHIPKIAPWMLSHLSKTDYFNHHFNKMKKKFIPEPQKICLYDMWVNFQKTTEFNPVHAHYGLLSFIIFVQIPYTSEMQKQLSPGKDSNADSTGKIEFITFSNGENVTNILDVDKTWEGKCLIFPSELMHCVYPFFGVEKERITIAGNIRFTNE
jgi:hypothetical protein